MTISAYPPLEEIFPALKTNAANLPRKTLRDDVKSDLVKGAAWFNDTEFAAYHNIEGKRILCVFDRYESALAVLDSGRSVNKGAVVMAGVQSDLYLLFIRANEYPGSPRVGQDIQVDGRKFFIRSAITYDGVYEITLGAGAAR